MIGSFLRTYNDVIDERRRQDLYGYAAKVVGSGASAAVRDARADRLATWAFELRQRRWTRSWLPARFRAIGLERRPPTDVVATHAVRSILKLSDEKHAAALALIDELLTIRSEKPAMGATEAHPSAAEPVEVTSWDVVLHEC